MLANVFPKACSNSTFQIMPCPKFPSIGRFGLKNPKRGGISAGDAPEEAHNYECMHHVGHQSWKILSPVIRNPPCHRTMTGRGPLAALFGVRTVQRMLCPSTVLYIASVRLKAAKRSVLLSSEDAECAIAAVGSWKRRMRKDETLGRPACSLIPMTRYKVVITKMPRYVKLSCA